jgi:hypothetical protein
MRLSSLTATFTVICLALSARAGEHQFDVHLARPAVVGEQRLLTVSFTRTIELVLTGIPRAKEMHADQAVELRARAQVLEVDEAGNVTKARLVVEKGWVAVKSGVTDQLRKGDVLIAVLQKDKRPAVTREKPELSQDTAAILADALPYSNTLMAPKSDPSLFGSASPRKVGEKWDLDPKVLADLTPRKILLDKKNMSGTMTLTDAVKYKGVPSLKVRTKMSIPHYKPADGSVGGVMPRDFVFVDGFLDADFKAIYPIRKNGQVLKWTETFRCTATAEPRNHRGQATAATHATREVEFAELPTE